MLSISDVTSDKLNSSEAHRMESRSARLAGPNATFHLFLGGSSGLYDRILDLYRIRAITPAVIHTPHSGPGEEAGHMLVASGKGIYIVYASLVIFPVFTKRVKVLPLDEPDAKISVYVAWRNNEKSGQVLDFLRTVGNLFEINDV